jgi:hypothetical protein
VLLSTVLLAPILLGGTPGEAPSDVRLVVGTVPGRVGESRDLGPADDDLPFSRVVLLLAPRDPAALEGFLARQQDPTCDEFHRWLSPEEFGRRFGARDEDVERVSTWLERGGLTVLGPNAGRTVILFSGRLADVARAFQTEIHDLEWNGEPHVANVTAPTFPAELSGIVRGVLSLDDFRRARPLARSPQYTAGGTHFLAPADLCAIYGVDALQASGIDGNGTTIAIVGGSQISLDDARLFRQFFGLRPADPLVVVAGRDPGFNETELEGCLDVQWAGAVAPAAKVVYVLSETVLPAASPDLAALHAVDANLGDVLSLSWGWCEFDSPAAYTDYYRNLWAQAAAQGISVFVASGDTGSLGCAGNTGPHPDAVSVNGLASSPYCTSVGGTAFDEGTDEAAYWSEKNDPTTQRSVKGPIPEVVWAGSGGGLSDVHARPSWQQVPGLAPGPRRALPDVSLSASGHDAYVVYRAGTRWFVGGTSASAPVFAGIAALLDQKLGGRQGNLNPALYALGRAQYANTAKPAPFRDVTSGSNGYAAGPGYDLATGLGSVDAPTFVSAYEAYVRGSAGMSGDFSLTLSPGRLAVSPGGSAKVTATMQTSGDLERVASLSVAGLPPGCTAAFTPSRQTDPSAGIVSPALPARLELSASSGVAPGSYAILVAAIASGVLRRAALVVTISVPPDEAPGVELQQPVILDIFGRGGSHYTSDFFALNRSGTDATLLLRYVASPGTPGAGAPLVAVPLPAGSEFQTEDILGFLSSNGVALPAGAGGKIGTLFATFAGVSDAALVAAGSRTSTPNANASVGGSFGTFIAAAPANVASSGDAWIFGLKEDGSFRSNLALVHAPAVSSFASPSPVDVEVQLFDGERGVAAGDPIAYSLQPGEFHQLNGVLALRGVSNGYARVRRTSGTDRVVTYGVVNDGPATGGGTSDGSVLTTGAAEGILPIVLDLPGGTHYQTELTLANPSLTMTAMVALTYTPAALLGASGGGTAATTLAPGRQLQVPNAIEFLRSLGLQIPVEGRQGGTLRVTGAAALARTFNPNPDSAVGGTFGLAYPVVPERQRARTGAWVYGLRQDDSMRSNLAIADARVSGGPVEYRIEVYDADSRPLTPVQNLTRSLTPGQWTQIDLILQSAGVTHGYVRIAPTSGASDFVVYGVMNDGPSPGSHTSDGSYLGMVVEN